MTIGGAAPKEIEEMYWDEGLKQHEIAEMLGVTQSTVSQGMKRHGIKRKHRGPSAQEIKGGLSDNGYEVVTGELLGDGCIAAKSPHSAHFEYGVSDEDHRDWLACILRNEGFEPRTPNSVQCKWKESTQYRIITRSYPFLRNIYKAWYIGPSLKYTSGNIPSKRVPHEIKMTPTVLLHWWLGDGSINHASNQVKIATSGFTDKGQEVLVEALSPIGVEAVAWKNGNIGVKAGSRDRFFDYMADPPVGVKPHRFPGDGQ